MRPSQLPLVHRARTGSSSQTGFECASLSPWKNPYENLPGDVRPYSFRQITKMRTKSYPHKSLKSLAEPIPTSPYSESFYGSGDDRVPTNSPSTLLDDDDVESEVSDVSYQIVPRKLTYRLYPNSSSSDRENKGDNHDDIIRALIFPAQHQAQKPQKITFVFPPHIKQQYPRFSQRPGGRLQRLAALRARKVDNRFKPHRIPKKTMPLSTLWRCANCSVTKTTLPRRGPQGKHTLCNPCGIFYARTGEMRDPMRYARKTRTSKTSNC